MQQRQTRATEQAKAQEDMSPAKQSKDRTTVKPKTHKISRFSAAAPGGLRKKIS